MWSKEVQGRKYRLAWTILVNVLALLILIPFSSAPALAQDRVFLDLSIEFLGEYRLPTINFLNTPVGGLSAIAYDRRRDRFYAVSDDPSRLAPARFYTFKLAFDYTATEIGIKGVDIESVTFLANKEGQTAKGSITPKGIALTPQQTVFISGYSIARDQIAPFVQEFDSNGKMLQNVTIPERYFPDTVDEKERTKGIRNDLAFTSLTFNSTGTIPSSGEPINLFTAAESALVQDWEPTDPEKGAKSRLLHYLIGYGPPVLIAEYYYPLDPTPSGTTSNSLVELLSVDRGGHFLSLERSREQSDLNVKIFQSATGGATDTSRVDSLKGVIKGIRPVKKKLLLDLKALGIPLNKLQGMTLGPRLPDGTQSLLLVSDNDFDDHQATQFLLFRLTSQSKRG